MACAMTIQSAPAGVRPIVHESRLVKDLRASYLVYDDIPETVRSQEVDQVVVLRGTVWIMTDRAGGLPATTDVGVVFVTHAGLDIGLAVASVTTTTVAP